MISVVTDSVEETKNLGKNLGSLLKPGDLICLQGNLGTGKTALTQGIALGLNIEDYITSPTFNIIQEYQGRIPLYHMDVYRINDVEEMEDLGYDEYFFGDGVVVIEWAEKIEEIIPESRLWMRSEFIDETKRAFEFIPEGIRFKTITEELEKNECFKL